MKALGNLEIVYLHGITYLQTVCRFLLNCLLSKLLLRRIDISTLQVASWLLNIHGFWSKVDLIEIK